MIQNRPPDFNDATIRRYVAMARAEQIPNHTLSDKEIYYLGFIRWLRFCGQFVDDDGTLNSALERMQ